MYFIDNEEYDCKEVGINEIQLFIKIITHEELRPNVEEGWYENSTFFMHSL